MGDDLISAQTGQCPGGQSWVSQKCACSRAVGRLTSPPRSWYTKWKDRVLRVEIHAYNLRRIGEAERQICGVQGGLAMQRRKHVSSPPSEVFARCGTSSPVWVHIVANRVVCSTLSVDWMLFVSWMMTVGHFKPYPKYVGRTCEFLTAIQESNTSPVTFSRRCGIFLSSISHMNHCTLGDYQWE